MANACEVFGDIVPDIYIDQVFLEESVTAATTTTSEIQTPKITVNLKVLDELGDQGTYALLDDALEYKGVNFKQFLKVHCILLIEQEVADSFVTSFEDENYTTTTDYFSYPDVLSRTSSLVLTKTLEDFTSTYINEDGATEIINSFTFSLGANSVLDYLRAFCFIELDTQSLETQFGVGLPNEYKTVLSRYQDELVISNSALTPELTIFTTEDGDLWDGAIHTFSSGSTRTYMEGRTHVTTQHDTLVKTSTPISNVQDFRIRDEIEVLVADFAEVLGNQYLFPEQKQILDREFSKNSYFSEMFVTKDVDRNARFFFAFDYGKYVLQSSKYTNLISKMSDDIKQQIIDKAKIVKFMIKRRQVKESPARNRLGSPVRNSPVSDGTIEAPVILSLDDSNLSEITLVLAQQTTVPDSLLRYFTGIDKSMSVESDGFFQYFVELEVQDGFIPIMEETYSKLSIAASNYERYVALTQIPGVYDSLSRKFTARAVAPQSMSGQDILLEFFADTGNVAEVAVSEYLNALSYFVDLSGRSSPGSAVSKKEYFYDNINTMLSPTTGGVDGVIMFQKLLTLLLSQVAQIFSVGHSGGGVEDTVANQPSNASSLFQLQTSGAQEYFDNAIGARFLNESYIDNVNNVSISSFAGLSPYTQSQLGKARQFEQNYNINAPINQIPIEALGIFGITYEIQPALPATVLAEITKIDAGAFVGDPYSQCSPGAVACEGNSKYDTLSIADLATPESATNINKMSGVASTLVNQLPFSELGLASPLVPEELTEDQLQTKVDVLVGFVTPSGFRGAMRTPPGTQVYTGPSSGFSLMIREARFETRTISELTTAFPTSAYYLCRQTRRSDIEVVDSYFLVTPAAVTNTAVSRNPEMLSLALGEEGFASVASTAVQQATQQATLIEEVPTLATNVLTPINRRGY